MRGGRLRVRMLDSPSRPVLAALVLVAFAVVALAAAAAPVLLALAP